MEQVINGRWGYVAFIIMMILFLGELCFVLVIFRINNRKMRVLERQMNDYSVKQENMQSVLRDIMQDIQSEQESDMMVAGGAPKEACNSVRDELNIINEVLSEVF